MTAEQTPATTAATTSPAGLAADPMAAILADLDQADLAAQTDPAGAILQALEDADQAADPADLPEADDSDDAEETIGRATYSPEDNKLRLYARYRLPADLYQRVKAAGFKWAPKQELFVAPSWTPAREDLLLELCGEIDDEDYTPAERAADRAERFAGYADKRHGQAVAGADRFEAGPAVFGHQSAARATRSARRHDRIRLGAVSQWRKAEYWASRTDGVIANALFKSSAKVRRGRVLTIEADLRRATPGGRWAEHLQNRLTYERAMLAQEGGMAADLEIIPGGWFGSNQVQAVNRSPVTGRVVSVKIWGRRWWVKSNEAPSLISVNIERLAESDYRAPTAEELAQFEAKKKADKKAAQVAKKSAPKAPQLINPTEADAQRLQDIFNAAAKIRYPNAKPTEVVRMTQAQYSAASGGTYSRYGTLEITEKLTEPRRGGRQVIFKIRQGGTGGEVYGADRVVILTDKPQKSIPWELVEAAAAEQPSPEKLRHRLGDIASALARYSLPENGSEESKLIYDAKYVGWAYILSHGQFGFTEEGQAAWQQWREAKAGQPATV